MKQLLYILLVALFAGCIKVNDAPVAKEDAALVSLLNELDKCQESGEHGKRFKLYSQIAAEYEKEEPNRTAETVSAEDAERSRSCLPY